jgi:endonuclease-3
MGCERLFDPSSPPHIQRFHILVGLMLSSQTKDAVTSAAVRTLQTTLPGGLTPSSVAAADPQLIDECIGKVGFHNTKTKNLKRVADILLQPKSEGGFDGDIPSTAEDLMSLPGVGPKMAYLCLSAAWDIHNGIGVDTHVHRITNLWGWHRTKTPEETRIKLQGWLPREHWHEINTLVVGLGQTVCAPVGRKCGECGLRAVCPASVVKRKGGSGEGDIEDWGLDGKDRD